MTESSKNKNQFWNENDLGGIAGSSSSGGHFLSGFSHPILQELDFLFQLVFVFNSGLFQQPGRQMAIDLAHLVLDYLQSLQLFFVLNQLFNLNSIKF